MCLSFRRLLKYLSLCRTLHPISLQYGKSSFKIWVFLAPTLEELSICNSHSLTHSLTGFHRYLLWLSLSLSHLLWSAYISALCYPTTSVVSTTITIVVWSSVCTPIPASGLHSSLSVTLHSRLLPVSVVCPWLLSMWTRGLSSLPRLSLQQFNTAQH